MKNAYLFLLAASLLTACGRTEKAGDQSTTQSTTASADSGAAVSTKRQNCQSVVSADKLGKSLEYKESAKPITVTLTLNQDSSTILATGGCYFNNTSTVLATKRSGSQLFKRTMLKDDLKYFIKNDELLARTVLQNVTYKPTFNGEKYFLLTMRLLEPTSKMTTDYTLFVNYHGEILKVR